MDLATLGYRVDTKPLKDAAGSLRDLGNESKRTSDKLKSSSTSATRSLKEIDLGSRATAQGISVLNHSMAALAATVGSLVAGGALLGLADEYKSMQSQIKLVTEGTNQFKQVQGGLIDVALSSRSSLSALTKLYSAMAPSIEALSRTTNEAISVIDIYSKALALTNPTVMESASATLQFSQAMGSGVLRGEEFNSIMENGRGVALALADGLGKPIGQLRVMAENGELTAKAVIEALESQADAIEKNFGKIDLTVNAAMINMRTQLLLSVGKMDEATGASSMLASGIQSLSENLEELGYLVQVAFVSALTAKAIPALYATATAAGAAAAGMAGLTASIVVATRAALAFSVTPIGAALTAVGAGMLYLSLKTDEAADETDRLTKSFKEQGLELSKAQIRQKADEIVEYTSQLKRLTQRKAQNAAVDIFDKEEKKLRRYILNLKEGRDAFITLTEAKSTFINLQAEFDQQAEDAKKAAVATLEYAAAMTILSEQFPEPVFEKEKEEIEEIQGVFLSSMMERLGLMHELTETNRQQRDERKAEKESILSEMESATESIHSIGDAWVRTGDKALDAMGSMLTSMAKLDAQEIKTEKLLKKSREAGLSGEKEHMKLEEMKRKQSLKGTAEMFAASSAMYKDGSELQKAAHAASMAMQAAELAANLPLAISNAVVAVTNQAKGGDPYTAIPRALGMVAMMGGVLSSIGGSISGGGSTSFSSASSRTAPDGSPLGGGVSSSIANTFDMLQDMNADQYRELRGINDGVKSLNSNITGVVSSLLRTGELSGIESAMFSGLGKQSGGGSDLISSVINEIGTALGGRSSTHLTGSGISIGDFQLGQGADVRGFNEITRMIDPGAFRASYQEKSTSYTDISGESERLINAVFFNLRDTAIELGNELGMNVNEKVDAFKVSIGNISTIGKSGEEIEKELSAAISGQADKLGFAIFEGLVSSYGKLNEGAFETVSRLAVEKGAVGSILGQTGQSLIGDAIEMSQSIIEIAGSLNILKDAADEYYDKFFTEEEKAKRSTDLLVSSLADAGLQLPKTRAEYRKLTESLELSGDAAREQYVNLLKSSELADDYYSKIEDKEKELKDTRLNSMSELLAALNSASKSIGSTLQTNAVSFMSAQSTLSSALDSARSGRLPTLGSLNAALDVVSRNTSAGYSTALDFARDQAANLSMITELASYTEAQLSIEEQLLNTELDQVALLAEIRDGVISNYDYNATITPDYIPFDTNKNASERQDMSQQLSSIKTELLEIKEQDLTIGFEMIKHSKDMADLLEKHDVEGVPPMRLVVRGSV